MRSSIAVATLSVLAMGASAQSNPATQYLTETNSLGVITGQPEAVTSQPSVVTSQPAVVTSQQPAASIPAGLSSPVVSVSGTRTFTSSVKVTTGTAATTGSTKTETSTETTGSTGSSTSSGSSSSSTHASSSTSTGGAAIATAGLGMLAGAALAAFAL